MDTDHRGLWGYSTLFEDGDPSEIAKALIEDLIVSAPADDDEFVECLTPNFPGV